MHTLAAPHCLHTKYAVTTTRPTQFLDLTDMVAGLIERTGLRAGFVNIQSLHTTAAIVLNEHEPLLLGDFEAFLETVAPRRARYQHDDPTRRVVNLVPGERSNGHAHCRALLLPTSACLNVADGELQLGKWQRLFLVELDGPRTREVSVVVVDAGDGARSMAAVAPRRNGTPR
jgi:secondary thiamine-phosphate synthase enzyme